MNNLTTICKTTGETITLQERTYRDGQRNNVVLKLQKQLGKTRQQILSLFRFYAVRKNTN